MNIGRRKYKEKLIVRSIISGFLSATIMAFLYIIKIYWIGSIVDVASVILFGVFIFLSFPVFSVLIFFGVLVYGKVAKIYAFSCSWIDALVFFVFGGLCAHFIHKLIWHSDDYLIFIGAGAAASITALFLCYRPTRNMDT